VRSKVSSEHLLRALDGEGLHLEVELQALLHLGNRVRVAVPEIPLLDENARRRIWSDAISRTKEPTPAEGRILGIPRLAWGVAGGLAVALIVVLVMIYVFAGGPAKQAADIASLRSLWGEIHVISPQGQERLAREGEILRSGDSLISSRDSRGIVEFGEGSTLRLDGDTEVVLQESQSEVAVEIVYGKSYHRVAGGTPYSVFSENVRTTAEGTAFTFDVTADTEEVMDLQSSVEVEVMSDSAADWNTDLGEGEIFIYSQGQPEGQISNLSPGDLENEWIEWNKDQDAELGFPLGALSQLDGQETAEGQTNVPADQQPPSNTDNQPAPQPTPQPQPAPTPPPPPVDKSLALSAQTGEGIVYCSWTLTGYSGFQGFKLCRSETNPSPSYPGDWWQYVDGDGARSTSDNTVQAGHTYYYRVGVYSQGSILGYSNMVQVTVPGQPQELSISMSVTVVSGKVKVSWSISGSGTYDGVKVCRSETNPNPSYPGEYIAYITSGSSYTDADVVSGHTYYYRVGILKDGSILKYSNSAQVTIP
jgi:FecR protein